MVAEFQSMYACYDEGTKCRINVIFHKQFQNTGILFTSLGERERNRHFPGLVAATQQTCNGLILSLLRDIVLEVGAGEAGKPGCSWAARAAFRQA